jgi:hypothetical protein
MGRVSHRSRTIRSAGESAPPSAAPEGRTAQSRLSEPLIHISPPAPSNQKSAQPRRGREAGGTGGTPPPYPPSKLQPAQTVHGSGEIRPLAAVSVPVPGPWDRPAAGSCTMGSGELDGAALPSQPAAGGGSRPLIGPVLARSRRDRVRPAPAQAVVDGYTWTRIPGTDLEVRVLTDKPLALRYRPRAWSAARQGL